MPASHSLQTISQGLLNELLRARTEFLLQQTALWQGLNDASGLTTVFAKPESLDVSATRFEFCIVRKVPLIDRILNLFRKQPKGENRFRLCGESEKKKIRVTISIRHQAGTQSEPDITMEPDPDLKPREIYVSGITA